MGFTEHLRESVFKDNLETSVDSGSDDSISFDSSFSPLHRR